MPTLSELIGSTTDPMGAYTGVPGAPGPEPRPAPPRRNWMVEPDLLSRSMGFLEPGMTMDDAGRVSWADTGEDIQIIPRPRFSFRVDTPDGQQWTLPRVFDAFGYMTGGVGGAPKGAIGAGAYRRVEPSAFAGDPTVAEIIAKHIDAAGKRTLPSAKAPEGGYPMPERYSEQKLFDKANRSLMTLSMPPSANAWGKAERALDLGFDTPAFHVTSQRFVDPAAAKKSSPWLDLDPLMPIPGAGDRSRGATYFADTPSGPITSGAAQLAGPGRAFGFMLKDVMGETPLPSHLQQMLPQRIGGDKYGVDKASLRDIRDAFTGSSAYKESIGAANEARMRRLGEYYGPDDIAERISANERNLAEMLANIYYRQAGEDMRQLVSPSEFRPVGPFDEFMPKWGVFEKGAVPKSGDIPGVHGFMQDVMGAAGFGGSRVYDEMRHAQGKSFGMFDPSAVRAAGAQFKDPYGNLVSAQTPLGSMFSMIPPEFGGQRQ